MHADVNYTCPRTSRWTSSFQVQSHFNHAEFWCVAEACLVQFARRLAYLFSTPNDEDDFQDNQQNLEVFGQI